MRLSCLLILIAFLNPLILLRFEEISAHPNGGLPLQTNIPHTYDETGCKYVSYEGLVMAGYQGWFTCAEDGAGRGWHHYQKKGHFTPGASSIDLWPDVKEYPITYETDFTHRNGDRARVYSPYNEESVDLHFKWMKEYGIDGVFIQRFVSEIKSTKGKQHFNKVLKNALKAARKYNRAICIMYDLSGCSSNDITVVEQDWKELQQLFDLFNNAKNPSYLRHHKKPLVAIWGIGFNDGRRYTIADTQQLITNLKNAANPVSVLVGVPYYWRELIKDTENSPLLHSLIQSADILMPWAVGRYNNRTYGIAREMIAADLAWCKKSGIDYVPLVFPGFSWGNLKNDHSLYNQIPRNEGTFLWNQIAIAKHAGAKMLYVAMFDEMDEGTAIFKCLRDNEVPLNAEGRFVGIENTLATDYYLWLTGQGANWFHGIGSYGPEKPARRPIFKSEIVNRPEYSGSLIF